MIDVSVYYEIMVRKEMTQDKYVKEKIWKTRWQWIRHRIRRCMDASVWRCGRLLAMDKFRKGIPKEVLMRGDVTTRTRG